jgi:Iap family predicted aminopeptidase
MLSDLITGVGSSRRFLNEFILINHSLRARRIRLHPFRVLAADSIVEGFMRFLERRNGRVSNLFQNNTDAA